MYFVHSMRNDPFLDHKRKGCFIFPVVATLQQKLMFSGSGAACYDTTGSSQAGSLQHPASAQGKVGDTTATIPYRQKIVPAEAGTGKTARGFFWLCRCWAEEMFPQSCALCQGSPWWGGGTPPGYSVKFISLKKVRNMDNLLMLSHTMWLHIQLQTL